MQFTKDLGTEVGFSKFNHLAVEFAKVDLNVRFADNAELAGNDIVVHQLGDGRAVYIPGCKRNVFLVHDWYPNYERYVHDAAKVVFLGHFDHPHVDRSTEVESYPVPKLPDLPNDGYEVLVTGMPDDDDVPAVLEKLSGFDNIRVVCYDDGMRLNGEIIGRLVAGLSGKRVEVKSRVSEPMLYAYIRNARTVVHVGGHRGHLHSLAVLNSNCISLTGDDGFVPPEIRQVYNLLPRL